MLNSFPRGAALCVCSALLVAQTGCGSALYDAAERERSIAACLRFLEQNPHEERSARVLALLDEARYRQARLADRVLGYRRYLELHPGGRFVRAARQRLADKLLARADTAAKLELVVEYHPSTPAADGARQRLAELLATRAVEQGDIELLTSWLRRFADHPRRQSVARRLAALRFAALADDPADLERFVDQHGQTRWGELARKRLKQALFERAWRDKQTRLLRQLELRFPADPQLAPLRRAIQRHRIDSAVSRLDLDRLQTLQREGDMPVAVVRLLRWCEEDQHACERLRRLARAARAWSPRGGWRQARRDAYSADTQRSWRAIAALGYSPDLEAGERLWDLLGERRSTTVWAAAEALGRWLARDPARKQWVARKLRQAGRSTRASRQQARDAYLKALAGDPAGFATLEALLQRQRQALRATILLLALQRPKRALRAAMLRAVRRRLGELEQLFPVEPAAEAFFRATLLEQELYVLSVLIEQAVGQRSSGSSSDQAAAEEVLSLRQHLEALIQQWRTKLLALDGDFVATKRVILEPEVRRHQRGRGEAMRQLIAASAHGRYVARAVCSSDLGRDGELGATALSALGRVCRRTFPPED